MIIEFGICATISLLVAWYLATPFFRTATDDSSFEVDQETQGLLDQKGRCVQVIKDLELDYATKKVSEGDFLETQTNLMGELSAILKRLEKLHQEKR